MRVLLKISGEALSGEKGFGFDFKVVDEICEEIKNLVENDIEIGIVVGGGNLVRGALIEEMKIDRCNADNMGMLATNINTILLSDVLTRKKVDVKIVDSVEIDGIIERFNKQKALKALKNKKVIIFGGGTGNPYFTTDTAGVLRALEIEADMIIKATKVDGVYDKDPMKYKDAVFISKATYDEAIQKNLRIMDSTAIAMAKDNHLMIKVVNLFEKEAILKAIKGKDLGTTINN